MHLRWDPKKWAIDRYVPGSQAPGRQGFLPTLHNSAALWHMSGALWISVEWAYKSDRGIPREDLPIALLASLFVYLCLHWGFPYGSVGKEFICNGGDLGLIPGLERVSGEGNGNPLQYSCLDNPHGQRNLAGYSPWPPKELDTAEQLSTAQHTYVPSP